MPATAPSDARRNRMPKRVRLCVFAVCWLSACSSGGEDGRRCGSGTESDCAANDGHADSGRGGDGSAGLGSAGTSGASGSNDGGKVGPGSGALSVRVEDIQKMAIELITLQCAGDCADIRAVAVGGNPPYAFEWEDGSTEADRRVCPDAMTE